uniref:hypothetical protein n=1 Tax=Phenylobacterium sp. TaxID=1871053 RepID=UPI0025E9A51C
DFTGAGAARVQVRAGADVKVGGGPLALVAGAVGAEAGSSVTGAGTVLYGAANDFTVRFGPLTGDLDLLDFVVPATGGTAAATPLTLLGQTVGGNVFLAVVNRAEVASAVINAPGLIAAQSAALDRGDVVLAAGVSIVNRQPGPTRLNGTTETTANFGVVSAQRDLLGGFASPTALAGVQFAAGRDLGLVSASLDAATLNAGRQLAIDAGRGIALRAGASAGGAASFRTTGAFSVGAGGVNSIGRLQIDTGSLLAGQLSSGRSVVVNASGVGANGAAVSLGSILADDDIAITTTNVGGHIVLRAATITGARGDDAPAGRNLSLTAKGAQADVTYGAPGGTPLTGVTKVALAAGRDVTANVAGLLSLNSGAAGRNFTIRAGDLDIVGPLTAATLRIESLGGAVSLGGGSSQTRGAASEYPGAPTDGLRITDAEFQQIQATTAVAFYAGASTGTARGDITVQDLNVNPAHIPSLLLAAGPNNDVNITGNLAPGITGGIVTIGETTPDAGFQPGRILLSGSIGVAKGSVATGFIDVHALGETHLYATNEIVLGSARFIALVEGVPASQIDIANNLPVGVSPTPDEQGHVFITTGVLTMSASARILMQNTGTKSNPSGILIDDSGSPGPSSPTLVVTTPGVVDLFGSVKDTGGALHSGVGAGLTPALLVSSGGGSPGVRFNGLDVSGGGIGGGRGGGNGLNLFDARVQQLYHGDDGAMLGAGEAAVASRPEAPPLLTAAEPAADEILLDPVAAATGSYELWRNRPKKKN